MRTYTADEERTIRVARLVDEWTRSGLLEASQRERIAPALHHDLRRTNRFLRLTLFAFGIHIIGAAVALVAVTFHIEPAGAVGTLCLLAAAGCLALAELLTARFRLYRFGVEEAAAAGAAVLTAFGSALIAGPMLTSRAGQLQLFVGLVAGSIASCAIYLRFGYVYAAVAAMLCASMAPFQLDLAEPIQRLLGVAVLCACFIAARMKRRHYGDEFPGDEYGTIQASAWLGIYAFLNLHLFSAFFTPSLASSFYWFTFAMTWMLPLAGLWLSIKDRDRPLLDASLAMALVTLLTNKPYRGVERQAWDPILFGLLLIGTAMVLRRWLANGEGGLRFGFTASRVLGSDKETLAVAGIASAAIHGAPPPRTDPPSTGGFEGGGGRSGGAGAGGSF